MILKTMTGPFIPGADVDTAQPNVQWYGWIEARAKIMNLAFRSNDWIQFWEVT
jgi:hypothetical protein